LRHSRRHSYFRERCFILNCDSFIYISTRIGKFLWRNRRIVFGISTPIVALGTAATMTMWLATLPMDTGLMALIGELIPLAPLTIGGAVIAPPAIFLGILAGVGAALIIGGVWLIYSRNKKHTVAPLPDCLADLAKEAEESLSNLLANIQPVHLSDDLSQTLVQANAEARAHSVANAHANASPNSVAITISAARKRVRPSPVTSSESSSPNSSQPPTTSDSDSARPNPSPNSKTKSRKPIETLSSGSSVEASPRYLEAKSNHTSRRNSAEAKSNPSSRRNSSEPTTTTRNSIEVDKKLYEEIPPVLAQ